MTDYTTMANEAKTIATSEMKTPDDPCDCVNCLRSKLEEVADALLACQLERDAHADGHLACSERLTREVKRLENRIAELERERDGLASAIWGEPQPSMTVAETCRQAVDQRVAFDAIDAVKAERDRLRAERDRLAAEVERLRAKLTCPECGQEIHAAHSLECSHDHDRA